MYEGSGTLLDRAKRLSRVEEVGAQCGNVQSSFHRKAMQLCLNLARALQNVHAQNWLHCDLRAANILIKHVDSQVHLCLPKKTKLCFKVFQTITEYLNSHYLFVSDVYTVF